MYVNSIAGISTEYSLISLDHCITQYICIMNNYDN